MRILTSILVVCCVGACGGLKMNNGRVLDEFRAKAARTSLTVPVPLVALTSDELYGRLSPNGRWLAFVSNQKDSTDIWLRDLTTGALHRLTQHVANDIQPAWSADGSRLAFVSLRNDVKGDVFYCHFPHCSGQDLIRLTDRKTADSHPFFSPDGKSIVFASGPEGRSRIERIDLGSRERSVLTDWGATHPALDAAGKRLAYTVFDYSGHSRIALKRLDDPKAEQQFLTGGDYHVGFPSFSPDGAALVFSRFYRGPPKRPRQEQSIASIWQLSLSPTGKANGTSGRGSDFQPIQLTSDDYTALLPQYHTAGLVFTTRTKRSTDIVILPRTGSVSADPAGLAKLAESTTNSWRRLFLWRRLASASTGDARISASYRAATFELSLGEFSKAKETLKALATGTDLPPGDGNDTQVLAKVDLVLLPLERLRASEAQVTKSAAAHLISRLDALPLPKTLAPRVAAYLLLKRGQLLFLSGDSGGALAVYQSLLAKYPRPRSLAAEAKLAIGRVLSLVQAPMQMTDFYLAIFDQYPDQHEALKTAAQRAIELYADQPAGERIKSLRSLIDRHSKKLVFAAMAQRRIGEIYEQLGQIDLAISAMEEVVRSYGRATEELAPAAFALGRLCLSRANMLGKSGRAVEALKYYSRAQFAYQQIQRVYPPNSDFHQRAKHEYLRLALRDGITLQLKGERAMAKKTYRAILETDASMLHAHRQLYRLSNASERQRMADTYAQRVSREPTDYVAHYGLAYAATLQTPLTQSDFARAEKHLNRMIELYPRSPFGHMTLGWVLEMQERYLGLSRQGFLERAIVSYEKAYALNDKELDPQTEGDLLVNLCNAFAGLGNGWRRAYSYCSQREKLKLEFLSQPREAYHYLVYGRASSAEGKYGKAERLFDRALDLFRDLGKPALEAETVARKALNSLLQGKYRRGGQEFLKAQEMLQSLGDKKALSRLAHSRSYALLRQSEYRLALKALEEAKGLLLRYGQRTVATWPPSSGIGRSTAAFGFDRLDSQYLELGLRATIFQRIAAGTEYLATLRQRRQSRLQALKQRNDDELLRELAQIGNQIAVALSDLGQWPSALHNLLKAASTIEKLQTTEGEGYVLEPYDFVLQVALLLNASNIVLNRKEVGEGAAPKVVALLKTLESRRAARAKKDGQPILPQRLRLQLWTDLALLQLGNAGPGTTTAKRGPANIQQTLAQLDAISAPYRESLRTLRRVEKETRPTHEALVDPPESSRPEDTLAQIWHPLNAAAKRRWHLRATLNLAQIAVALVADTDLSQHGSTTMLRKLLSGLAKPNELGSLTYLLRVELAYREQDLAAMRTATRDYANFSPLLMGRDQLAASEAVSSAIYDRAVALALKKKDVELTLAFAEEQERRIFVETLIRSDPKAEGFAEEALTKLLALSALPVKEQAAAFPKAMAKLKSIAPRVAELFSLDGFSIEGFLQTLHSDDIAFALLIKEGKAHLVSLLRGVAPTMEPLGSVGGNGAAQREAFATRLRSALTRLSRGAKRVYLDLGQLDQLDQLLPKIDLPGRQIVHLATLSSLVDAHARRNLARLPVVVAGTHPLTTALANRLGAKALTGKGLSRTGLFLPFDRAGLLAWTSPLRFDTNGLPRLLLFDPQGQRLDDWKLGRILGVPLRAHVLLVGDLQLTPGYERRQRVALMRLLHAAGIPSVAIARSVTHLDSAAPKFVKGIEHQTAAAASSGSDLQLWGYAGIPADNVADFSQKKLKQSVFGGAKAYKQQRYGEAIDLLENALRLMDYSKTYTYKDGALNFVAKAYTLNEDYPRAIPRMEELIDLRREAVSLAKDTKARLKAQGSLVAALQSMAWLRYRKRDHNKALAANAEAIAVYKSVNRPLAALAAYSQRSLIAEASGDQEEALVYANLALKTALASLKKGGKAAQKAAVAKAALRSARLLRQRFSRYLQATASAKLALFYNPLAFEEEIVALKDTVSRALVSPAKQQAAKAALASALSSARLKVDILLEIARIENARGDYGEAVKEATAAYDLAEKLGLENMDAALLEIVNNLYYLGAYGRALKLADKGLALPGLAGLRRIQFHNAKGSIFAALGHTSAGLDSLDAALKMALELRLPREIAASHNNIGNAYRLAGSFTKAKDAFRKALALDREHGDKLGMAFNFANLGLTEAAMGRGKEARTLLKDAISASDKIGAPLNALKALVGLCQLNLRDKRAKETLVYAEDGLKRSTELGLRNWLWKFYLMKGRSLTRLGKPSEAEIALEAGLRIVEEAPPSLPRAAGVPKVDVDPNDLYDALIDLLAEQKKTWDTLALAERRRARSFVDLVSNDVPELGTAAISKDVETLVTLHRQLEVARADLTRNPSRADAQKSVKELAQTLAEKRALLATQAPQLGEFVAYPPQDNVQVVARLRQLAQRLALRKDAEGKTNTSVYVIYYHTGTQLLIWTLRGVDLQLATVAQSERALRGDVETFRRQLLGFHPIEASARRLHRTLIRPVEDRLTGKELVIVPFGSLHTLPFAALHNGKTYLTQRFAIRYAASLSAFDQKPPSTLPARKKLSVGWAGNADDIPLAEREAQNFASLFGDTTLLVGDKATRQSFLNEAPTASLIHLATHARYRENAPFSSSLQLADGGLKLTDILELKLQGPLVVLSACETGTGLLDGADGTVSFQRAFLAAGASALLSSLWRVNDLGSALLMKYFFRQLSQGQGAAFALQSAQNKLMKRYPHPAFWAAFRLDDLR